MIYHPKSCTFVGCLIAWHPYRIVYKDVVIWADCVPLAPTFTLCELLPYTTLRQTVPRVDISLL